MNEDTFVLLDERDALTGLNATDVYFDRRKNQVSFEYYTKMLQQRPTISFTGSMTPSSTNES